MEEQHVAWEILSNPNIEAIEKRDKFLADREDIQKIEFVNGEIHAEISNYFNIGGINMSLSKEEMIEILQNEIETLKKRLEQKEKELENLKTEP